MKDVTTILVVTLLASGLGAGCVSSGPHTRQGAVGGAVAGGILGGIIGNNRGSGNSASGAAIGVAAGGLLGAAAGQRADRNRGTLDDRAASSEQPYLVAEPPPMPVSQPRERFGVRPAREAVWINGQWAYTGSPQRPYEWMSGHWEIPPPGRRGWIPGGWQPTSNGYLYVRGHWQ